jgi:hypothetical protein
MLFLLACRRSDIKGSITLDGAEFDVKECRVGQLSIGQKTKAATQRFVLLDDGDGRELHFSDEPRRKVTVYYVPARGKAPLHIGSGCASMTVEGDPSLNPSAVHGTLQVSCTEAGHALNGKIDYSRCKAWNVLKPGP